MTKITLAEKTKMFDERVNTSKCWTPDPTGVENEDTSGQNYYNQEEDVHTIMKLYMEEIEHDYIQDEENIMVYFTYQMAKLESGGNNDHFSHDLKIVQYANKKKRNQTQIPNTSKDTKMSKKKQGYPDILNKSDIEEKACALAFNETSKRKIRQAVNVVHFSSVQNQKGHRSHRAIEVKRLIKRYRSLSDHRETKQKYENRRNRLVKGYPVIPQKKRKEKKSPLELKTGSIITNIASAQKRKWLHPIFLFLILLHVTSATAADDTTCINHRVLTIDVHVMGLGSFSLRWTDMEWSLHCFAEFLRLIPHQKSYPTSHEWMVEIPLFVSLLVFASLTNYLGTLCKITVTQQRTTILSMMVPKDCTVQSIFDHIVKKKTDQGHAHTEGYLRTVKQPYLHPKKQLKEVLLHDDSYELTFLFELPA